MNFDPSLVLSQTQLHLASYIEGHQIAIQALPANVILSIFYHLNTPRLNAVSLVNKAWSQLTKEETLWKALYQRDSILFKTDPQVKAKETWLATYQDVAPQYISFVRNRVQQDGLYLQHASDWLKDDLETVKLAVQQNGLALQFVSDRLKRNSNIVELAFQQNKLALRYAPDQALSIAITTLQQNPKANLSFCDPFTAIVAHGIYVMNMY